MRAALNPRTGLPVALLALLLGCAKPGGGGDSSRVPADSLAYSAGDDSSNGASRPALPPTALENLDESRCAESAWQPKVETIVTVGDGAENLRFDADGERAVFIYHGRTVSMSLGDLGEQELFKNFAGLPGVARIHRGTAYWTEAGRFQKPVGAVRARSPGSSKAKTLAFGLETPESLVVRGDEVRWLDWRAGGVYKPDGKGGKGILIADAGKGLGHMATGFPRLVADRHHLYFSRVREGARHEDNGIIRTDWDGKNLLVLALDQHHVEILGVGTDYVFWEAEKKIRRVAKTGGPVTDLVDVSFPTALYVHEGYLYFIDNHIFDKKRGYSLVRIPTTGGRLETLYASPRTTYVLQHSGEWLYWIEHGRLEGECRTEIDHYEIPDEDPPQRHVSTTTICNGPAGRLVRMRLPRC